MGSEVNRNFQELSEVSINKTYFRTRNRFKSIGKIANWVYCIFILLAVLNIVAIISGFAQSELISRAIEGETVTITEAISNDDRQAVIGYGQTALYVAAAVSFLVWIHRAHKNLQSLNVAGLKYSPGWAVGGFFVPILCLFRPCQVAAEIDKASNPITINDSDTSWKNTPTSLIVGFWWALFLISNILGQIAIRSLSSGGELVDLLNSTYIYMVSDAIDIVGIIVTLLLVQKLGVNQEAKYSIVSRLDEVATPQLV